MLSQNNENITLTDVSLSHCLIPENSAASIFKALKLSGSLLRRIDFTGNFVNTGGAASALGKYLHSNMNL